MKPWITDALKQRVIDVLDSGYLTEGPVTREFERAVAAFTGARHVLATTSCTTGLELALRCLDIGPGDEVLVPDYTYPATAAVVNIVGATAVLVDVDPATLLVDYDALEESITPKTKAVIPVSLFGNPLDWDRLNTIRNRHNLFMVEDAACALGSSYKGRMTGAWGDMAVFSHHPRKFITTGEGGTVCTHDDRWTAWMHSYKHFGLAGDNGRENLAFERIGTNYKLSNILAAVGLEQMALVDELLADRRRAAERYLELLMTVPGVALPTITPNGKHSWQSFCVLVENRDAVMARMREAGIEVQIGTYALHMHKAFADNPLCRIQVGMAGSRAAYERVLTLPMYHAMKEDEQWDVAEILAREVAVCGP